jgi:selenide, water dikinase
LHKLPLKKDANLLVGFSASDDAGVYRINDETAIISTADFITPPVNDPYVFGQIAAANALSDVYAMGGRPLTCLNLVAFPSKKLGPDVLQKIVMGAFQKIDEAGALLVGGHSIDDDEPKFGLAVTGTVHPKKVWTNGGAQPGDVLILTKPIGSGVLFNANIKQMVSTSAMDECIEIISTLNKDAAAVMANFDIHSATDVTGFGLAGHAHEMAEASNVCIEIDFDKIPIMNESLEMYQRGVSTGSNAANRKLTQEHTHFEVSLPSFKEEIFFDPQTSGGLLVSVPKENSGKLLTSLREKGVQDASIIGRVSLSDGTRQIVIR